MQQPRSWTASGRQHNKRLAGLVIGLHMLFLSAPVIAEKYSLDDISEKERAQLAQMVDQLAKVEAIMQICGDPQSYDQRLQAKVRDCIMSESIDRIQLFFEQRKQAHENVLQPNVCQHPSLAGKFPELKDAMNDALWKIGLMCSLCLFC